MKVAQSDMLAKLQLSHIPAEEELARRKPIVEKRIGNSSGAIERRQIQVERQMTVLLCGKLQNPVLVCQKSIQSKDINNIPVIPLVAKIGQEVQKFKLPFRAAHSSTLETDFEFIFIKSVQPEPSEFGDTLEEKQFIVFDCMTFFCLPAVLKVGPDAHSVLTVQLQIDLEKMRQLPEELLQMQMTKLLVARIKNTKLIQSFYLTINMVE